MNKALIVLLAAVWLSGCIIVIADDDVRRPELDRDTRSLTLSAADLTGLVATAGAGRLELIGEAAREDIEVIADIHYQEAEDIDLRLERRGSQARLVARMRSDGRRSGWGHIDLVVRVPARFDLDLEDGSGDIDIRGLGGKILIEDGSGSLRLDGGASARIKDGSGSLLVENISGDVFIEDGSGALEVNHVGGKVSIDDGSGEIRVNDVGALTILEEGSGGLSVRNVRGAAAL